MRAGRVLLSTLLPLAAGVAGAADGLQPPTPGELWPQWQARITVTTATLAPVTLTALPEMTRNTAPSGVLLGDYYLDTPGLRLPSSFGGLRASGGLWFSPRGLATAGDTLPYLGVGYTGQAAKGGWGITADLGLVAERPGRVLLGNGGVNNMLREMRLSPVLQLGVSYAF